MTAGPFVSRIEGPMVEVREELHRCISDFCRHEHDLVWARRHRASLWPLLRLVLLIFLAGALAGSFLGIFLAQRSALGAGLSTSYRSFAVEGPAARAGRMVEAREIGTVRVTGRTPGDPAEFGTTPSIEPARATSHADATTSAASDEATAPQPPVLTTQVERSRDDPPTSTVLNAIHRAAREFGQHPGRMVGVAYCESTFDSTKVGAAGERGLWQFKASTWSENAARLGYGPEHITDVVASSRVAAEMWSRGMQARWTCAR